MSDILFCLLRTTSEWGRVSDECVISKGPPHFEGWNTQQSKWVNTLKQKHSHVFTEQVVLPLSSSLKHAYCFFPLIFSVSSFAFTLLSYSFSFLNLHAFSLFAHLVLLLTLFRVPSLLNFSSPLAPFFFFSLIVFLSVSVFCAPSSSPCWR